MSSYKAGLNRKLHRYFDLEDKMMRQTDYDWMNGNDGKGDALWRTGLAYITWQKVEMKEGILDCFRKYNLQDKDNYAYQGMRHTGRFSEDDVSRDQTILALSALSINDDNTELDEICSHLPYKLSRRFNQTPSMWCWVQNLRGKMWGAYIFSILAIIEMVISITLNKIIEPLLGLGEEIHQSDYDGGVYWEREKNWNKLQKLLDKAMWPGYAQHLNCWQVYTCKDNFFKTVLEKLLLSYTEKGNLLFRLLLRDKSVTIEEINAYQPMTEWRWSIRMDGSSRTHIYIPTSNASILNHNQMDKDILYVLHSNNGSN